jgi:hypothetical protein
MNDFIDIMFKTIIIVFLLVLTLFMFSLLVEYVKFLILRHRTKKNIKKLNKQIDKTIDKVIEDNKGELKEEELKNALETIFKQDGNDNVKVDDIKVIKIDKSKDKNE